MTGSYNHPFSGEEPERAFFNILKSQFEQSSSAGQNQALKTKAWQRFQELGLPTRQHEAFQYMRLRALFSIPFCAAEKKEILPDISPYLYPECTQSVLVFVNGCYSPKLSNLEALPKQVVLAPMDVAAKTYGVLFNNHWTKFLKEEKDPLTMLNAALQQDGLFLYVPPKTVVESPIQILNIVDQENCTVFPRLQLYVGANSQISLNASTIQCASKSALINFAVDFTIEENAHVTYGQFNQVDSDAWYFHSVRAHLKKHSTFKTVNVTEGSAAVRYDYLVTLAGENAEASLNGVWMLSDKKEAHTHVLIEHQAPNCRSNQLFKGVLDDFSRSSFEGKILVRQEAQKTEAFQLNNNLLLSDRTHADSKPNLEIFADDVKASHGATVGQLDPEQLFYMNTRGFDLDTARNLLVYSYCKEVLDLIPLVSLQEALKNKAKHFLKQESYALS